MMKLFGRIINIIRDIFNNLLIRCLSRPRKQIEGYNVFGYFSKYMGQAEVARAFTDSLIKGGEDIALFDFLG